MNTLTDDEFVKRFEEIRVALTQPSIESVAVAIVHSDGRDELHVLGDMEELYRMLYIASQIISKELTPHPEELVH